jgi:hypothetical protein
MDKVSDADRVLVVEPTLARIVTLRPDTMFRGPEPLCK